MAHLHRIAIIFVLSLHTLAMLARAEPSGDPTNPPITAEIDTTLATGNRQIRQFAFDGDDATWFGTSTNPRSTDHFTLVFEKPVVAGLVSVVTGRADDTDRLESGRLEISADGKTFKQLLQFSDGQARGDAGGARIKAIRIQPAVDHEHPLAIREIKIACEPAVAVFKYPVEFEVDVKDAPEMQSWADNVARICERAYPMINEELKSEGFKPSHFVTMTLSSRYRGVAQASGNRITGSVKFFTDHPDDVGAMVHETAHVVQQYRGRGNPGWLVEGVADYVRFFKFEPGNLGRIDAERAHYNNSYRVTAAFLAYVAGRYDKELVLKLNRLMRDGKYQNEVFTELTGKNLDDLDQEWRETLKAAAAAAPPKQLPLAGETFRVKEAQAFVMQPAENLRRKPQPWIWYAPTLPGLPDAHEKWMHEKFLAAGITVAGIDVGESYGGPAGRTLYSDFYNEMTERRGFAARPVLLGRSRGGLMICNWAVEHPDQVAAIVGIYPVFDLRTYPGLDKAAAAYGMAAKELGERSAENNPIERVGSLAKARVPTFLIHGDVDKVVPLHENSAEFVRRYEMEGAGASVKLVVAKDQGHNYWEGFFRCQELVDFAIEHAAGDAWPKFRGPDGQGRATSGRIPVAWSEFENVLWKLPIPGRGWSSPVISGGVCWLTTAVVKDATPARKEEVLRSELASNPLAKEMEIIDSVSLRAISIDLESGRILQNVELLTQQDPEPIHSLNSYASPTPVLHGGRLYCHFGNLGTARLNTRTAEIAWKTRLPLEHSVGPGSSPVVYDNLLIIPCDGTDSQSVVALDVATGKPVWQTKRPPMTGDAGDMHKAFSSPLVFNDGHRDQVVIPGAQWVVSYNPRDGQPLWQVRHGEGFSNAPCPIYANGMVYICTGYMTPELVAIRVDGTGDVTNSHVAWRISKQVPAMSSPIVVDGRIYMASDQGVVTCADAQSGEVLFRDRAVGNHSASPLAVDGKLLFSSRQGDVTVARASDAWEVLSKNHLDGQLMASPAVWRDSLIIRSDSHLYRIGEQSVER
ncbi:MAG TPA: PQQ-binding-like beta-propeller repeat protein [Planctomycetaceae bacterium]|jgi:hypothetical protein